MAHSRSLIVFIQYRDKRNAVSAISGSCIYTIQAAEALCPAPIYWQQHIFTSYCQQRVLCGNFVTLLTLNTGWVWSSLSAFFKIYIAMFVSVRFSLFPLWVFILFCPRAAYTVAYQLAFCHLS